MWSRLREVFARELVVLVDPTNPLHARRRKQLTASVGTVFTLGMAAAMGVAPAMPMTIPMRRACSSRCACRTCVSNWRS